MKKGGVVFSGIISIILGVVFLLSGTLLLLAGLNVSFIANLLENALFSNIYIILSTLFLLPLGVLLRGVLDTGTLNLILPILLVLFALFFIVWGVVELNAKKKEGEDFVVLGKKFAAGYVVKLLLLLLILVNIILMFVLGEVKPQVEIINEVLGLSFMVQIIGLVLAFLVFITIIVPLTNFSSCKKALGNFENAVPQTSEGQGENEKNLNNQAYPQGNYPQEATYPQANEIKPLDPLQVSKQPVESNFGAVPGENGVPQNITPKGIEDLNRLERLRSSGAISEENYIAMREKVIDSNKE